MSDLPCVIFEDDHILVVNKPAGLNPHAPSLYAGEGVFDWLRDREPRWAQLGLIHRLDKDTSGIMVLAKTPLACRSLTDQFTRRTVRKRYRLMTDRPLPREFIKIKSWIVRRGPRYESVGSAQGGGEPAETHFRVVQRQPDRILIEASPVTGRTHQIRVQAAAGGFPLLGDVLYGGTPAHRLFLHAEELTFRHPQHGTEVCYRAPCRFEAEAAWSLREAIINRQETEAYRLIHGAADGWPGWYVDRVGDLLLSQSEDEPLGMRRKLLTQWRDRLGVRCVWHKRHERRGHTATASTGSFQPIMGDPGSGQLLIKENGLWFELRLTEGYSTGLFLDQRDNRRRFLRKHIAHHFPAWIQSETSPIVLNTFAYTGGFSVCAAAAGMRTVSLDLSAKYLAWGKRNFVVNHLALTGHEFLRGDVFEWLPRLARKGRRFDAIVLDPPTFSTSKYWGGFRVEKDYPFLVRLAVAVLTKPGLMLASTNAATCAPAAFTAMLRQTVAETGRRITAWHYSPQPPDFPVTRTEPAYLKTVWLRLD